MPKVCRTHSLQSKRSLREPAAEASIRGFAPDAFYKIASEIAEFQNAKGM